MEQRAMTNLPAELDRLIKGLVGEWKVEVSMQSQDGRIIKGSGNFVAKEISSGRGINSVMRIELKGLGHYEENVLWSFDQVTNEIINLSVTSDGRVLYHTGKWIDDATFEFELAGTQKEKGASEDIVFSIVSSNEVRGHIIVSMNSHTLTAIDYVLRRI